MSKVVGIFGSRNEYPIDLLRDILSKLKVDLIIVGDCRGVDESAYRVAKQLNIPVKVVVCYDNHPSLTYRYNPNDVIEIVGDSSIPLSKRFSQLAIRIAKQLKVPTYVADPNTGKLVKI